MICPQVFEDLQRLGELRVRGGFVLLLAVKQATGVQQPGPGVAEGHPVAAAALSSLAVLTAR